MIKKIDSTDNRRKSTDRVLMSDIPSQFSIIILQLQLSFSGVPHRSTTTQVHIFPPDTGSRLMHFVLPARGLDYQSVENLLTKITGGRVTIVEIKPNESRRHTRAVSEDSGQSSEK